MLKKDIGNIEIHHVLDFFLSTIFDKGMTCFTKNSAKCVVTFTLHISTYSNINKYYWS